jgi:hypothetical protein
VPGQAHRSCPCAQARCDSLFQVNRPGPTTACSSRSEQPRVAFCQMLVRLQARGQCFRHRGTVVRVLLVSQPRGEIATFVPSLSLRCTRIVQRPLGALRSCTLPPCDHCVRDMQSSNSRSVMTRNFAVVQRESSQYRAIYSLR